MRFGAVIIAAGFSSRMNDFKPLMKIGGQTVAERIVSAVREAVGNDADFVVVTGHNRAAMQQELSRLDVREVFNENYEQGMFTSIQAGIRAVAGSGVDGLFLLPVDSPLISAGVIRKLMERAGEEDSPSGSELSGKLAGGGSALDDGRDGLDGGSALNGGGDGNCEAKFLVPVFEGKKGHPLYISAEAFEEILQHDGTHGLKGVTDRYPDRMVRVPVSEEGCVMDMDTQEDYAELVAFAKAGCQRASVEELARGHRIVLVRHGETEQHAEPIFIGQVDVPLNDLGREQVAATSSAIAALGVSVSKIYSSDLSRAVESAGIVAGALSGDIGIVEVPGFREIALGEWDGRPVREIREAHPDEYEQRGRDIFVFKTGNKSENFYDMQYRAVKALREILEMDKSCDIVIVAHSGVIRALENNLRGLRVDDDWKPVPKGGFVVVE